MGVVQDDGKHRRHEQHVMAGQEDVPQRCQPGDDERADDTDEHREGDVLGDIRDVVDDRGDRLIRRDNARHAERAGDERSERE
jgi:hypothetical protein